MLIINRDKFLSLPAGTLFSKYYPQEFQNFAIKGESIGDFDFFYQPLVDSVDCENTDDLFEKLSAAELKGKAIHVDLSCESRDGMFQQFQLYAVWEKSEVLLLIQKLQAAITTGYPELQG